MAHQSILTTCNGNKSAQPTISLILLVKKAHIRCSPPTSKQTALLMDKATCSESVPTMQWAGDNSQMRFILWLHKCLTSLTHLQRLLAIFLLGFSGTSLTTTELRFKHMKFRLQTPSVFTIQKTCIAMELKTRYYQLGTARFLWLCFDKVLTILF